MERYNGKLLELPKKGKALIITDLHGNIEDYNYYLSLWEETDSNTYFIVTGDFIHGTGNYTDYSLQILDSIRENYVNHKRFHILLGNHECAHITGNPVYKGFKNQKLVFEDLLCLKYGSNWRNKLNEYKEFFIELPVAAKTSNKVFISHAGPSMGINNIEEVINITNPGYSGNTRLSKLLWNRPENYTEKDLNSFLKAVGCKFSIAGHTPVDGFKNVFNRQLIISSSYSLGKKACVELDLKKDIRDINDLIQMVKYVE